MTICRHVWRPAIHPAKRKKIRRLIDKELFGCSLCCSYKMVYYSENGAIEKEEMLNKLKDLQDG